MRIRSIELYSNQWTVDKYQTKEGDYVRICEVGTASKGEDRVVWEGPIHTWLELRVVINDLHALICGTHKMRAFPAHEALRPDTTENI